MVLSMMRTWSVETETNSWNDDLFNGLFDECISYCKEYDIVLDGKNARLAEIVLDDCNAVVDCIDFYTE